MNRLYQKEGSDGAIEATLKAVSDTTRRKILTLLKQENMSVSDLASRMGISVATTSYHLAILKEANLVTESKHKNFVFYELNLSVIQDIILWFRDLQGEDYEKDKK